MIFKVTARIVTYITINILHVKTFEVLHTKF